MTHRHPWVLVPRPELLGSVNSQWSHWGLYRTGWVSAAAPSRRMRGPLGLRIFLMADVFMRLSRRMRLKPLGETPDEELSWAGEEG